MLKCQHTTVYRPQSRSEAEQGVDENTQGTASPFIFRGKDSVELSLELFLCGKSEPVIPITCHQKAFNTLVKLIPP
jgi:hypothetical protein